MRVTSAEEGGRQIDFAAPEAALLRQALQSTVEAYETDPSELDPMVGNAWYGQAGLREAGIRGEDAIHWVEGLHEARMGRGAAMKSWLKTLPSVGQAGRWILPKEEVESFLAACNDHRLRRAAEFDLGEGDLEVRAMERAKGDNRIALVEIHFLAWMIELILHE